MFSTLIGVTLFVFSATQLATAHPPQLAPRAVTVLNNGTTQSSGTVVAGLKWQATGSLTHGPCPGSTSHPIDIGDCYQLSLVSDPKKQLDHGHLDSPRQRIEFYTSTLADGQSFSYQWRMYLSSQSGTSSSFFHLMQVFSHKDGGPVITLDAVKDTIAVKDYKRTCGSQTTCPSIALSRFTNHTTVHKVSGVFGPKGRIDYHVSYVNGTQLLRYNTTGYMGSGGSYIKFGTYRAAFKGMTAVNAAVGVGAFTGI
ncbi:hypothetical protein EXIGLDRAFT_720952 [Exidia glandulosa HHB12029]|uniref:Uncharacterized protein n=1 Tax=Exidia glandulosa HHB12029 TaxID=1314781 RepID=A0A165NGG5_EXIGL|nr:hypothetical protein EXIGLDRAFT_720952 [Exidia glandulosa HHB12029]